MYFETTKIRNSKAKGDELERIIPLIPAFVDAYLIYGNVERSVIGHCAGMHGNIVWNLYNLMIDKGDFSDSGFCMPHIWKL